VGLVGALALLVEGGPERPQAPARYRYELSEAHMGTLFRIVLYAPGVEEAGRAARAAFDRIAELDAALSDYRDTSEVAAVGRVAGRAPVRVGIDLFVLLQRSQALAERSAGAFDVTVGPLSELWRRARRNRAPPAAEALEEALSRVGWRALRLDPEGRTAHLEREGMRLDLGGIAKGYAADEAQVVLRRHGIGCALVAASGDIVVTAPPPGSAGWRVAIAALRGGPEAPVLLLRDAAVSTSGDESQGFEANGVRRSHIVDPRTGEALQGRSSVTIVARDGATADGLATAVSVLGAEQGGRLVDETEGAAAFVVRLAPGAGRADVYQSSRFGDVPKAAGPPKQEAEP
jgi:thiamine biosynthesis lipoprotein